MAGWVNKEKWEIGGLGREARGRVTNISYMPTHYPYLQPHVPSAHQDDYQTPTRGERVATCSNMQVPVMAIKSKEGETNRFNGTGCMSSSIPTCLTFHCVMDLGHALWPNGLHTGSNQDISGELVKAQWDQSFGCVQKNTQNLNGRVLTNPLASHYLTVHMCTHTYTHKAQSPHMRPPSISFRQVLSPPQRASEEMIHRDATERRERQANVRGVCELQGAS